MSMNIRPRRPGTPDPFAELERVLVAFGMAEAADVAPEGKRRPRDERTKDGKFTAEVRAAEPLIIETVAALDALRARIQPPTAYVKAWRTIVERWNATILRAGWTEIPTLCESCGLPVLVRRLVREHRQDHGDAVVVMVTGGQSRTCTKPQCRDALKKRRRRAHARR